MQRNYTGADKGTAFLETLNSYRKGKGPRLDLEGYLTRPEDMTDDGLWCLIK
jgi:hypothetical protein